MVKGTSNPEYASIDVLCKLGPRVIRLQEPISLFSAYRTVLQFSDKKEGGKSEKFCINLKVSYFQIQFYYYSTSSRIVFVCSLRELKTPKSHFEIN